MAFLETDCLLIEAGIPDDGGRNLGIIRLNDPDPIVREILIADVEGIAINHRLNHRRIQKAQLLSGTKDRVSHALCSHLTNNSKCCVC